MLEILSGAVGSFERNASLQAENTAQPARRCLSFSADASGRVKYLTSSMNVSFRRGDDRCLPFEGPDECVGTAT